MTDFLSVIYCFSYSEDIGMLSVAEIDQKWTVTVSLQFLCNVAYIYVYLFILCFFKLLNSYFLKMNKMISDEWCKTKDRTQRKLSVACSSQGIL